MGAKKGIITLTLVISRGSESSTVRRGAFVMFNIFKVKTKFQLQVEEYVEFKGRSSPFIAEDQEKVLRDFMKEVQHTNISEVTLTDLEAYYSRISRGSTQWRIEEAMKALRAFMRFHRRYTSIQAWQITGSGIKQKRPRLQSVVENVIIPQMTKRKKVGRPPNVAFIKEIKDLVDKRGLGIRAIARAKMMNPGNISRAYNYDLSRVA